MVKQHKSLSIADIFRKLLCGGEKKKVILPPFSLLNILSFSTLTLAPPGPLRLRGGQLDDPGRYRLPGLLLQPGGLRLRLTGPLQGPQDLGPGHEAAGAQVPGQLRQGGRRLRRLVQWKLYWQGQARMKNGGEYIQEAFST